jgi:crossover junction endodeoxyribonuclease RuvC
MMRVLGIDTSLRSTGLGVVEAEGSRLRAVEYGTLKIPPKPPLSECLKQIHDGIDSLLERVRPDAVAVEGIFFSRNVKTAVALGQARGVAICVCASRGVPVYEYAPRRVKQAVVGVGSASKEQVRRMLVKLLGLQEPPQEDAGDALAIAICHLHNAKPGYVALQPEAI